VSQNKLIDDGRILYVLQCLDKCAWEKRYALWYSERRRLRGEVSKVDHFLLSGLFTGVDGSLLPCRDRRGDSVNDRTDEGDAALCGDIVLERGGDIGVACLGLVCDDLIACT